MHSAEWAALARRRCRQITPAERAAVAAVVSSGAVTMLPARRAGGAYQGGRCAAGNASWQKTGAVEAHTIRTSQANAAEDRMIAALDRDAEFLIAERRDAIVHRLPATLSRPQWFVWSCRQGLTLTETAKALGISKPTALRHYTRGRERMITAYHAFVNRQGANCTGFQPTGVGASFWQPSQARHRNDGLLSVAHP